MHLKFDSSSDKNQLISATSDSLGQIKLEYSKERLLTAKSVNGQTIFYDYDEVTGRVRNVTTSAGNMYR